MTIKSKSSTRPNEIEPGDAFVTKIVAVFNGYDWAAYASTDMEGDQSADYIAKHGDKISEKVARGLFYALDASGHPYRR